MNWLIVEDALRDRKGHWFEYIQTFRNGLLRIGDKVDLLVDHAADPFIVRALDAQPVLPESIWHRMGAAAGPLTRLARIPLHALATYRSIRRFLETKNSREWTDSFPDYDIIFVPTILPHHLLGWFFLLKGILRKWKGRFVFFFLSTPVRRDSTSRAAIFDPSPAARLLKWLIWFLGNDVRKGRVVLAVETFQLRDVLSEASGVPFVYLPQPVELYATRCERRPQEVCFGCYGAARHEKGSDVLQLAVLRFLSANPEVRVRFVIQWITDFRDDSGTLVEKNAALLADKRVEFVSEYFQPGEYEARLATTDILLLPYRVKSYGLRGSRVAIDAMVNGIPVVITRDIASATLVAQFGSALECDDGSVESLSDEIVNAINALLDLKAKALLRMPESRKHFSVRAFKMMLVGEV